MRFDTNIFYFISIFCVLNCEEDETFSFFDREPVHSKVRGPGYEYPRYSFPSDDVSVSPRWLIVAGRQVVPGSIYRVVTEAFQKTIHRDLPLTFRASISHNGQQITSGKTLVHPGEISHILLQIPDTVVPGKWELLVQGQEGHHELPVFKNSTLLRFTPNFLTILVQTSRPVYNAAQTVRFRAVMLTREMKPYEEPVNVFILDAKGYVMRRWPSHQTGDGIINLSFKLPEYPLLGNWTVQIRARQQVQNQTILVEQYFRPRFEVFVRLPQTFKVTDKFIEGVVIANMTNWRDVHGNCSVKLQLATNEDYPIPTEFETVSTDFIPNFKGFYPFRLPMEAISHRTSSPRGIIIRVFAEVGDNFFLLIQKGWALAKIVEENAKVLILGDKPIFFKPGMPFSAHVFVSYEDDHPFADHELEYSEMVVTFRSTQSFSREVNGTELLENKGVVECVWEVPDDATTLEIEATFVSSSGLSASTSASAILHHSPRNRYLQVETSTENATPGQYIILHARCNFRITHINFLIVSNNLVVYSGREPVYDVSYPSLTTFAIPASSDMSPVAKILAWVLDYDYEIITHSISIPVSPLGKHQVDMRWNEHKDHSGGSVEIKLIGEVGAFFASSAVWEETHMMDSGHDFDKARILHHMMGFHDSGYNSVDDVIPHIRMASTKSRKGYGGDVRFFSTPNASPDAPTTFNFSDVVLLTDAMIYYHPAKATDSVLCEENLLPCLTGGCYSEQERCDGLNQCSDYSDETGCIFNIDPFRNFRLHRISRINRFYDDSDGDWAWRDVRSVGDEIQVYPIPKRPQNWVFSMFSVGTENGLGIYEQKVQFDSAGPFMLTVEAPPVARMWEQVGLTVGVFNFHLSLVWVFITIAASEDTRNIYVEENGVVSSYNPRSKAGEFQHLVWLKGGESKDVNIPIIFTKMGTIEVTVVGSTQMMGDSQTVVIEVVPEGASIGQHASVLLDLKSRSLVYEFLDIHLDETPIVPYQLQRTYIFSTTSGYLSVTGDVVGPAFSEIPVSEGSVLGFGAMGAETYTFNFASNLWSLHYLRLTNQLSTKMTYEVLTAVNVDYAALARFQNDDGGFSNWIGSENSVWLTAYVLKNLWIATFQDWENYLYVDNRIIEKSVEWLFDYQTPVGSFQETEHYIHPLDPKVDPRSRGSSMPRYLNISLTAHVVIALETVKSGLQGDIRTKAIMAEQRAVRYLENYLETLTDPYDLAVVAWALLKSNSESKSIAYNKLHQIRRVVGNNIYWSRGEILFSEYIYENSQKPFLQVKPDNEWDAHAVESTAYALLVYIKSDGIGIDQENIVRFLNAMRETDGGMISTIDSLVALEALVEYSYRARIRDITDMHIDIQRSANPNDTIEVDLKDVENLAQMQTFEFNEIFGHLSVVGRGSGQALIQLTYSYSIDNQENIDLPPIPSFNFNIVSKFVGRNNSLVSIRSCQRWINTKEAETSGVAMVDIHLPSGYYIMQDELIRMVERGDVRNLRWALRTDTAVKFFFNYLDTEEICFEYTVERWYPVSNHSRFNMAIVYELYQPERFEEFLFEVYPLYSLDICEVCGSYQCPYCPFYSNSPKGAPVMILTLVLSFLAILNSLTPLEFDFSQI